MSDALRHKVSSIERRHSASNLKPCYRTAKCTGACAICGTRKRYMHMPTGHIGNFCRECCPACIEATTACAAAS